MKEDRYGCWADYEHEKIDELEKTAHDRMECPALCPYCLDWLEENYPERNKEKDEK